MANKVYTLGSPSACIFLKKLVKRPTLIISKASLKIPEVNIHA